MVWNIIYSHGSSNSMGTAILFRKNLEINDLDVIYKSPDTRIVFVKVEIKQRIYYLLNLYSPNVLNSRIQFYNQIKGLLVKYSKMDDISVMGGDYNIILDENLDKKGGITKKKEQVVDIINKTIQNFDLIDIWRLRNPDIKQFTWRQKNAKVKCRLDYWLISNFMQDSVAKVDNLPFIKSDHSAVVLEIRVSEQDQKGKGYWKLNNSI